MIRADDLSVIFRLLQQHLLKKALPFKIHKIHSEGRIKDNFFTYEKILFDTLNGLYYGCK